MTFAAGVLLLAPLVATAEDLLAAFGGEVTEAWQAPEHRAYDFWIGEWRANWRPRVPDEVENADTGSLVHHWVFPVLDGKALVELARSLEPNAERGYTQGFSVRYHDAAKGRWVMAQNWPGPNGTFGFLDQLEGAFRHGRIELYATNILQDGGTLLRRYTFSDIRPRGFRWDNARSTDGGETWSAGTVAEFERIALRPSLPAVGKPLPDYADGAHCDGPGFDRFAVLEGRWRGTAVGPGGSEAPAELVAARMQDGCSVLALLRTGEADAWLQAWTWSERSGNWFEFRLPGAPGAPHTYLLGGEDEDGRVVLERNDGLVIEGPFVPRALRGIEPWTAIERTVWERLEGDGLAFVFQRRGAADMPWETMTRFRLAPAPR